MKGFFHGNDSKTARIAFFPEILSSQLDGGLIGFGPLLQKNTRSAKQRSTSQAASSTWGTV
jgi:hypothetical protein